MTEAKIFDTHAHYDDDQFDADREVVLNGLLEQGVELVVNVGASLKGCSASVQLANQYSHVYAAVGVHPDEVGDLNDQTFEEMKALFQNDKVVAVGEIGLDYYWDNESHDVQKEWFVKQLNLARELDLPVIIHSREAAEDTFQVMKEHGQGLVGVIHCYSYSVEMAKEYVKMGYYLGVGGVVTFNNAKKLKEVVKAIPLEQLVVETDAPYLSPVPNRGKRNTSANLVQVVEKIAELKEVTYEEVVAVTNENGKKLYRIK